MRKLLMIFAKKVEPGKVKTRLAASIGDKKAADVYSRLLTHTLRESKKSNSIKQIWYSKSGANAPAEGEFEIRIQQKGDLGDRLKHAFTEGFDSGFDKVVVIGSDCASLTNKHIETAFSELDKAPCVIGPSEDGGYYLLGLNRMVSSLFRDIDWSTDRVFGQTVAVLNSEQLDYRKLEMLNDIDTIEDLENSSKKSRLV